MKTLDHSYHQNFEYRHQNPYHDKLGEYSDFVFRDTEGESLRNKWSNEFFKNENPINVEVGCGYGHFMSEYCKHHPYENFVGIDYRFKRSFALAKKLSLLESKNFCLMRAKGERIQFLFGESEIDRLFYFFPDPWPKTKHHKKRLFQAPFLDQAYQILKPGGELLIKTDHDDYADWMSEVIKESNKDRFEVILETKNLHKEQPEHFLSVHKTKFEGIFLRQGIKIKAFVLKSKKV